MHEISSQYIYNMVRNHIFTPNYMLCRQFTNDRLPNVTKKHIIKSPNLKAQCTSSRLYKPFKPFPALVLNINEGHN